MNLITRTIYSSYLQTCLLLGIPFQMKSNTTLNEKFGIEANISPAQGTYPKLAYLTIGNRGLRDNTGPDGILSYIPNQHLATDAACYNHIPFILRRPDNDITSVERVNYALRREEVHNGDTWIAYYAKRMNLTQVEIAMELHVIDDQNNTVSTPFIPTSDNLSPTPQPMDEEHYNILTGQYVNVAAKLALSFTPWEIQELINVSKVLYNNDGSIIISEMALVTGVDKTVSRNGIGGSFNFQEVIAAQVASHITTNYPILFTQNGIDLLLEVGASEPLFKIKP